MIIRAMTPADIPTLRNIHELSGLAYTFPDLRGPLMENVLVIADERDIPIMAVAAERVLQAYLLVDDSLHPAAKLRGIRMLHENMAPLLREKGYSELNCAIPPELERSFGRRLMRTFGWVLNWTSYARHF